MDNRIEGIVKWFNDSRGYGFIQECDESPEEYFVHFSAIEMDGFKTLKEGQKVSYNLVETPKGVQAADVRVI
jgi:CspA family cold shock protein